MQASRAWPCATPEPVCTASCSLHQMYRRGSTLISPCGANTLCIVSVLKLACAWQLSKDGGIKGLALLDSKLLGAPQTFTGRRFAIAPLRQSSPALAANPGIGR